MPEEKMKCFNDDLQLRDLCTDFLYPSHIPHRQFKTHGFRVDSRREITFFIIFIKINFHCKIRDISELLKHFRYF